MVLNKYEVVRILKPGVNSNSEVSEIKDTSTEKHYVMNLHLYMKTIMVKEVRLLR